MDPYGKSGREFPRTNSSSPSRPCPVPIFPTGDPCPCGHRIGGVVITGCGKSEGTGLGHEGVPERGGSGEKGSGIEVPGREVPRGFGYGVGGVGGGGGIGEVGANGAVWRGMGGCGGLVGFRLEGGWVGDGCWVGGAGDEGFEGCGGGDEWFGGWG